MDIVRIQIMYFLIKLMICMLLTIVGIILGLDALYFNKLLYNKCNGLNIVIMIILQVLIVIAIHPYIVMMGCIQIFLFVMDIILDKIFGKGE